MSKTVSIKSLKKIYNFFYIYINDIEFKYSFKYLKGLKLYNEKKYDLAREILRNIPNQNPNLLFKLGMCYFKEKKWVEAEYYFNKSVSTQFFKNSWLKQLYQARSLVNQNYLTETEINQYVFSDSENNESVSNIVELIKEYISEKKYSMAVKVCDEQRFLQPLNSEIWFLSGCIEDEFLNYTKAEDFFLNAYELNRNNRNYKYRYAFCLEKNSKFEEADKIYNEIIVSSKDEVKKYGIGILHAKRGLWDNAISEFKKIKNNSDVNVNYHLYNAYYFNLSFCEAAETLENYIDNLNGTIDCELYLKLAKSYYFSKNYLMAIKNYNKYIDMINNVTRDIVSDLLDCLRQSNKIQDINYNFHLKLLRPNTDVINSSVFLKTNQEKFWDKYIYYYENLLIRDNVYLFESFAGDSVSCNPYAILRELLKEKNDDLYVVVCNNHEKIPEDLLIQKNIIYVKKNSELYIRYLATAKFLINNTTFSPYFIKKEGQVYLMTWHGTPIKSLGRDQKNGFMSHSNVTRNFLHADYIISPNPHTTDIILNKYDIKDIYSGKFYEVGYPRVDLTLCSDLISREKLNIEENKKVILYAPTWRGGDKLEGNIDVEKLLSDLNKLSKQKDYVLFYKSHHLIENILKEIDLPVRLVPENIDINAFLSITDCLISDYSSIIFDYLPLNKPIISYIYDYDDYIVQRGDLYFSKDKLFGSICETIEDVVTVLSEISSSSLKYDYSQSIKEFCNNDKGLSAKNVIDIIHNDSKIQPLLINQKPVNLIFCGSFLPNGVTNSFKNLIKQASQFENCRFALIFDTNAVIAKEDNLDSFQDIIDLPIIMLPRVGAALNKADEKWLKNKTKLQNDFFSQSSKEIVFESYRREVKRLTGNVKFENVINFDGYSTFWVILLSQVEANKKIIYLHNNMYEEWKTRFPYLNIVFKMYNYYDTLNSVSEACYNENHINLTANLGIKKHQVYSNNVIDYANILAKSEVKPSVGCEVFEDFNGLKFINVARLSVEKDQAKLIRAFHHFVQNNEVDVRLYIVGYGPLEQDLQNLISSLKLDNMVHLIGYQSNPYYFIKNSDLFVFSSNYEGQGLVLLESMILNIPVVTTNIAGVQSVIQNTNILAVENSIEGLVFGMKQYIDGYVETTAFDFVGYNENAIYQFSNLIY
ncbi:glycosyltransferase [Acinetobacter sp. 187]|uniref:CDP-glycerol glycerophosphotransferase family protein n=1 Tax=Acinetobacter lanii TaxID=2715163 RepID=UPI00140BF34D|nr:CDP-glycerol glycerophosphotransferase family protein [Acinetobacter lanii]NHC03358.1 glycosyltransferase [Acinetobacter lanii]